MKEIKKILCLSLTLICVSNVLSADNEEADTVKFEKIVKELSSEKYQGRGYAGNGVRKAGQYLKREFLRAGADEVSTQTFTIDINTFPSGMEMSVDGYKLAAGSDFVLREYSPGAHGNFRLYYVDTLNYDAPKIFEDLAKPENSGAFVVCDFWFTYKHKEDFKRLQSKDECCNSGLIYTWKTPLKFYKAYGEKVVDKPIIWVSSSFPKNAESVSLNIDNKFLSGYRTENIIAKVEGKRHDSCFVFTAHYDHLGKLGRDVYFPGANDNASGAAAIVTLAEHYAGHKPEFDIWFIAFSGEDANLRGSSWFIDHPLFPLQSIKYLFNLDMIGDNNPVQYCEVSDSGVPMFEKMQKICKEQGLFNELYRGELAANSDHWPFAEKGVPCILFENESGDFFQYYHTTLDNCENTVSRTYVSIFKLVTETIK